MPVRHEALGGENALQQIDHVAPLRLVSSETTGAILAQS